MIAAIIQRLLFPNVPEYVSFSFASGISFIAMIIGTYATRPTDREVLLNFFKTTRPFGFWQPIRQIIPKPVIKQINRENRRDKLAIFLAVPWQIILFLMWIALIMRNWTSFVWCLIIVVILSVGLYFLWFKHLSTQVKVES
jgi:hypothetical protein